jgi:hypothetical protein
MSASAGLLACGSSSPSAFPEPPAPVARRGMPAAHSCGGQSRLRANLSPRSLLRPAGAGTDQPRVQRPQDASQAARQVRIDKGPTPTIKCRHRRSLMRERTGNVVRNQGFPCHSCPRNCKRRARATTPLEASGKAVTGGDPRARRPAVDSDARRAGCLGAARFARGTRIASSPLGSGTGDPYQSDPHGPDVSVR